MTERSTTRDGLDRELACARLESIERLSSGLSHDVRNPLNAMAIHLELLTDKLREANAGSVPPHLAKNLEAARGQIRRLATIVQQFADFATARRGIRHVRLGEMMRRVAALCAHDAKRSGVTLETIGGDPEIEADGAQLEHVLFELYYALVSFAGRGARVAGCAEASGSRATLTLIAERVDEADDPEDPELLTLIAACIGRQGGDLELERSGRRLKATASWPLASGDQPGWRRSDDV